MTEYKYPMDHPAYEGKPVLPASLVLEGGGLRAQFTSGVLDFFMEKGLVFEQVVGVSAGALSGANYAAGLYGRTAFLNLKYCADERYFSFKSFRTTGNVCGRDFMFRELMEELEPFDKQWFNDSPMHLVAVSSNLETGEPDYHEMEDFDEDLPYLVASSSLPLLSQIVEVDGKKLLDGGTTDSIPFRYAHDCGYDKRVVVLTQHAEYKKHFERTYPVARRTYAEYPDFLECIEHRHFMYNKQHKRVLQLHEQGKLFAIVPPNPITINMLERNPEPLLNLYAEGYAEAALQWPALKAYLGI